jgi:DHA1 family bicyclomycin/chloramphenicol resistance-like MFS transporter
LIVSEDTQSYRRQALVLGLVALAGPLAMNMYVPAFPAMATALGVDSATIQFSLVSYLAALACGQNIFGPLSDRFGRKAALYAGFVVFIIASACASLSQAAEQLIAFRFMQGLGACAAMAVPRAIIRDRYTGATATRMMSLMVLVMSIGPLCAPFMGTGLVQAFGWRSIFWFLTVAGSVGLALVFFALPETLPSTKRSTGVTALQGYRLLLRNQRLISTALMLGFSQSTYYAFLSGSPLVFMTMYGFDAWHFSLIFVLNAVAWSGSAQFAGRLVDSVGSERLLLLCIGAILTLTAFLFVLGVFDLGGIPVLIVSLALVFAGLGVIMPVGTVLALHPHGAAAGSASAIIGTASFTIGAIASLAVASLADGTEMPMLGTMAACAMLSAAAAVIALKSQPLCVK